MALWSTEYYARHHVLYRWRCQAIADVTAWSGDARWVQREANWLDGHGDGNGGWLMNDHSLSDRMVHMATGEWVIYKQISSDRWPFRDLFIGQGSDGVWYHSSNHFCTGMLAYQMQVDFHMPDLKTFVHLFHLVPFDGKPDEDLRPTATWANEDFLHRVAQQAAAPHS